MANDGAPSSAPGSPAAGAVAPARLSDLAVGGSAGPASRPDAGMPADIGAPPEKMVPLFPGPDGTPQSMHEPTKEAPAEQTPTEEPAQTPEQTEEAPKFTAAELAAKWLETGEPPAELAECPIWVDDGKGNKKPVQLKDIHNNVLLYDDYQRKTTELGQQRRKTDAKEQGIQRWVQDMISGDPNVGLRAIRALGADKTLNAIVVQYIQQMAELEQLPESARARILEGQKAADEAFFAKQYIERMQAEQAAREQQQQEQQGPNAPEIKFVQDAITEQLPDIQRELGVIESEMYEYKLSTLLRDAATGQRDPQTGQWIVPPTIQIGRRPSREVLRQIVLAAKQAADASVVPRKVAAPPTQQLQGSGPAAKPGQRGNISAPAQSRFSDLANSSRPR